MIPRPLFPNRPVLSFLYRYGFALLATAVAWVVRTWMDPVLGDYLPTPPFFAAVTLAAWLVGPGPAVLAAFMGAVLFDYSFMPAGHVLELANWAQGLSMIIYFFICFVIIACLQQLRRSQARLKQQNLELDKAKRECYAYRDHLVQEEQSMHRSEQRYRTLIDQVSELVWVANPTGEIIELAPSCMAFTGLAAEELLASAWVSALHPEDREYTIRVWEEALRHRRPLHNEYRLRRYDGQYRYMEVTGVPLFNEAGEVVEWVGNNRDVTERKLHEARLQAHAEQLEHLVRERTRKLEETVEDLNQFSYSIAHDLRSPLRAISGYVSLAERDYQPSDNVREFFRRIKVATSKMDRFITDSLNYTKVLRQDLPTETVDLDAVLPEIIDSYPDFQPNKVDIELVRPLPRVMGHEAGLTHAFANLLTNAIKFVRPGQRPSIRIWALPEQNGLVRVCVKDHGIGIPEDAQQLIWNMFHRVHGDEEYEGTGIGLAIVKKVTTRMGGKVGLQSAPGQGSTFWLDLLPATSPAALAA